MNGNPFCTRRLNAPLIKVSKATFFANEAREIVQKAKEQGLISYQTYYCTKTGCNNQTEEDGRWCDACRHAHASNSQLNRPSRTVKCKCGKTFSTISTNGEWCSTQCRLKHKNAGAVYKKCENCRTSIKQDHLRESLCPRCHSYIELRLEREMKRRARLLVSKEQTP